jgi:phage regulator Rha-like protein
MEVTIIQQKIYEIRGFKVMLDFDLAELYDVETKVLNQAVKRNKDRFPVDFMFDLNKDEWSSLRSQFVTLDNGRGKHSKYLPQAFTEHGVTMLASILRSEKAVKMNIAIVRAFIALREMAMHYKELAQKIAEMEKTYNKQFSNVYEVLQALMEEKQQRDNFKDRERIGFKQPVTE